MSNEGWNLCQLQKYCEILLIQMEEATDVAYGLQKEVYKWKK